MGVLTLCISRPGRFINDRLRPEIKLVTPINPCSSFQLEPEKAAFQHKCSIIPKSESKNIMTKAYFVVKVILTN